MRQCTKGDPRLSHFNSSQWHVTLLSLILFEKGCLLLFGLSRNSSWCKCCVTIEIVAAKETPHFQIFI